MYKFKNGPLLFVLAFLGCGESSNVEDGDDVAPEFISEIRINEFSADSGDDNENFLSDWVELKNTSSSDIDLEGYFLTDNVNKPTKWMFPKTNIEANNYLVVHLSDDENQTELLTAPFSLDSDGEYLALIAPDGKTVVSEFNPYPNQRHTVSYGIEEEQSDVDFRYFTTPTPGQKNIGDSYEAITERVKPSMGRGFYEEGFDLSLESDEESDIYYTVDGTLPTKENGLLYNSPIALNKSTVVRSIAYKEGFLSSDRDAHSYLFVNDVLNQPSLPENFPVEWQPGVAADYAVDSSAQPRADLLASLRSYPTVSLSMPMEDWFNPSTDPAIGGIYSNSVDARGIEWELSLIHI